MTRKRMWIAHVIIICFGLIITACSEEDLSVNGEELTEEMQDKIGNGNDDDYNQEPETEVTEDNGEEDLSNGVEKIEATDDSDLAKPEEFSSTANPFQDFNRTRVNGIPIVLKFYSNT